MHKQLITQSLGGVVLLDEIVDITNRPGDQEKEDEGGNVMMVGLDSI